MSDLGRCNIYQVFDSVDKDQIQTCNVIDRVGNGYGIPLTEEQGAKELDWIKYIYRYKDIEIIKNTSPSDSVFKGFYNNGIGNWCNYLPIYEINGNVTTLYNWKI